MSKDRFRQAADPMLTVRKMLLSGFVVVAFAAYAIYERLTRPDSSPAPTTANVPASGAGDASQSGLIPFPTTSAAVPPSNPLQPVPTAPPQRASTYKNGTYQGQTVDAYYGLVQVQVNIQGGTIHDVEFLQYPNDRRTSVQINSIAMPYLQQEAIQAQSAQVDIISGATLTSEGFVLSLESALKAAGN